MSWLASAGLWNLWFYFYKCQNNFISMMTKSSTSSYNLIPSECYDLLHESLFGILTWQLCKAPRPQRTSPAPRPEPGWDLHLALPNASAGGGLALQPHPQALSLNNLQVERATEQSFLRHCVPCSSLIYHMVLEVTRALVVFQIILPI